MTDLRSEHPRPPRSPLSPADPSSEPTSILERRLFKGTLPVGPFLVFAILIGATIPWRAKTYFDGGLDPVVLAKAGMSMVALALAVVISLPRIPRARPAMPLIFLTLYLTCTVIGGWATGDLVPAVVIAVRVMLIAAVVIVLSRSFDGATLITSLIAGLTLFAIAGSLTGIPTLASGRLAGGLPPLHPNELASTCALIVLWCLWRISTGQDTVLHLVAMVVAFGALLATGSRTPLVAMGLASVFVLLHARAIRVRTLVIALLAAPVVLWVFSGTSIVSDLLLRGQQSSEIGTLSNRTIAWQSALSPKSTPWLTWFGGGLQMKKVDVPGQFWEQQILDSSWVSAVVQGGFIGVAICAIWVLHGLISTRHSPRQIRALQLAIIAYLALRGFLESGLFDATTAFMILFTTVMATPLRRLVPLPADGPELTSVSDPTAAPGPPNRAG